MTCNLQSEDQFPLYYTDKKSECPISMDVPGTLIYSIGHELWRSECQQDLLRRQHADVDIETEMLGLAGDKSKQK